MSKLPKLKIRSPFGSENEGDLCDLEQSRHRLEYNVEVVILVDGQAVNSHEELVQLVSQERYRDREFLEVVLLPLIAGG